MERTSLTQIQGYLPMTRIWRKFTPHTTIAHKEKALFKAEKMKGLRFSEVGLSIFVHLKHFNIQYQARLDACTLSTCSCTAVLFYSCLKYHILICSTLSCNHSSPIWILCEWQQCLLSNFHTCNALPWLIYCSKWISISSYSSTNHIQNACQISLAYMDCLR